MFVELIKKQPTMKNYNDFDLDRFVCNLQDFCAEDVISEVMTSGLTDEEIIYCFKEITFSDTFNFKK